MLGQIAFSIIFISVAKATPTPDLTSHENYKLLPSRNECGRIDENRAHDWVGLIQLTDQEPGQICTGTLINKRHILTSAASCVYGIENYETVRLGDPQGKNCGGAKNCSIDVKIEKTIVHKSFDRFKSSWNDIALIRLEKDALPTDNPRIRPICLPFDLKVDATSKYIFAGWGKSSFVDESARPLLHNRIIKPTNECSFCPAGEKSFPCPLSASLQICMEDPTGTTPCKGDAGGPLIVKTGQDPAIQVGIASLSSGFCGDGTLPVIFTRVDVHLQWILDNLK